MANEFWKDSPFGENSIFHPSWEEKNKKEDIIIQYIKGPFDEKNEQKQYVSRFHTYNFVVTLNKEIRINEIYKIKWAISYDESESIFFLFSGGNLNRNKINVDIQISKGNEKFKIYVYIDRNIKSSARVTVYFKKAVAFFIGGAGDKKKYSGSGPTEIVKDQVSKPFETIAPKNDYVGYYLGYYEIYKKTNIDSNVIAYLKDKISYQVYIIGHSLGGWNGAHLYEKLQNEGYNVKVLITIDPVGTKRGVTAVSDIYYDYPNPISSFWLNTKTEPDENDVDDYIAFSGGQWEPSEGVLVNYTSKLHHRQAGKLFNELIIDNLSMSNILLSQINAFLNEK